jgi:lipid A 3-O-deacylase
MRRFVPIHALAVLISVATAAEARAQQFLIDEVRLGLYDHDTDLIGHKKESGVDFISEILSRPITILNFIGAPRFLVGGALNSAGQTNQIYVGLIRSWDLFYGALTPGDSIFIEGTLGGGWNDGKIDVIGTSEEPRWKSHGSHILFREALDVGYRFNPFWSVGLNFNHISNAGLARRNEGMNDVGLSVNMKLGPR